MKKKVAVQYRKSLNNIKSTNTKNHNLIIKCLKRKNFWAGKIEVLKAYTKKYYNFFSYFLGLCFSISLLHIKASFNFVFA